MLEAWNPTPRLCNCSVPRGRRAHIRLSQCHSTPSFCCKVRPLPLPATGSEAPSPWLQRFPARSYFDLLLACRLCRLCLLAHCHNAFVNLCSGLGLEILCTVNENYLCMCFFFCNYLAKTCEASCGDYRLPSKSSHRDTVAGMSLLSFCVYRPRQRAQATSTLRPKLLVVVSWTCQLMSRRNRCSVRRG